MSKAHLENWAPVQMSDGLSLFGYVSNHPLKNDETGEMTDGHRVIMTDGHRVITGKIVKIHMGADNKPQLVRTRNTEYTLGKRHPQWDGRKFEDAVTPDEAYSWERL
jgi:hypothetical protein